MKKGITLILASLLAGVSLADGLEEERRTELNHLLRHDCGSCHGLRLEGGLGPPLTPVRMRKRTPEYLRTAIREGIPGTAMPPWGPLLSDQDIDYLADALRGETP